MDSPAKPQLMGIWMCTALVLGNIIGTAVFMLPVALAPYGLNSVPAWLFTAAGAMMLAYVFARLARDLPESGGPFAYTRAAFGPFAGFVVAWGYWISIWVGNAAISTGSVAYMGAVVPELTATPQASAFAAVALIWLFTAINLLGVRSMGTVQVVTSALKLVLLVAVIGLGALLLLRDPAPISTAMSATHFEFTAITAAATLTLWAMLGLESATVPADKVENPERNIPRATLLGTGLAALISLLACGIVQVLIPAEELAQSTAPFAEVIRVLLGDGAAIALAVFATISGLGALNGWTMLQAELPAAMAKSGVFPPVFASVSSRNVPVFGLVFTSTLASALVLANSSRTLASLYTFMILISTSATLVLYLAVALAAIRLQRAGRVRPTAAGAGLLLACGTLGALYSIWTLVGAGGEAFAWCLALLAAGVPVYWWQRRQLGARPASAPTA